MKRVSIFATVVAGAVLCMATSAGAERITLQCVQTISEAYEMTDGQVGNSQSVQPDVVLEMDTATGEFSVGTTRGRFTLSNETFIGLAHSAPFYGAWDIDRATGRMLVLGHADMSGNWAFIRREGTCVGPNGAVPF